MKFLLLMTALVLVTGQASDGLDRSWCKLTPQALAQSSGQDNTIFLPRVLRGAGGLTLEPSDRLGGTTRALLAQGDRVFAGVDDQLIVFDVSEPSAPRPLASAPALGANIEAMVMDELLYVAAGDAGLHVYEVYEANESEDETPLHLYGIDLGASLRDLALTESGELLVAVEGGDAALILLDLVDPRRPRVLSQTVTGAGGATQVDVNADLVYLAKTGADLAVVDIADAAAPKLIFEGDPADERVTLTDLAVVGDLLIPIRHDSNRMGTQIVYRLDDPRAPVLDDGPTLGQARSGEVAALEDQLYVGYASDSERAGIIVATLGSGANEPPYKETDDLTLAPRGFEALALDAGTGRLYGGGTSVQLLAMDLSDPSTPVELGRHQSTDGSIGKVAVSSDVVLTITDDPSTFTVLDNRTERPLQRSGIYPLNAEDLSAATVQMVADRRTRHAYLMYYDSLQVMDAIGMDAPEPRKLLAAPGGTVIALDSDHLYIGAEGLRVFDVKNPARTEEIAHAFRAGYSEAIAADAARVYVAQKEPTRGRPVSLQVWDLQNRTNPIMAGSLSNIGFTVSMAARGAYAYQVYRVDDRDFGIQAYDASDPGRVRPLDRFVTQGYARKVIREGSRLYLIEESFFDRRTRQQLGRTGVHILDIADPARIRALGFIPFETPVLDIDVRDGVVYAALGEMGLVEVSTRAER